MSKLNERQKRFADEYIITGNITESAIKSGYSENYANAQGYKLLENVGIKKYIDERLAEKESQQIAKQDEVLSYLTSILRGEHTEQVLQGVGQGAQTIAEMDVSAKDRIKAAELLGKRYGLWVDRQDIDVKGAVTFVDDIGDKDET